VKIGPADPEILRLRGNKSGTTQNWLRNRKNWTGLKTFTLLPSIWCKECENWSSRSRDSFAQIKKRKKLRKVKYIALPASLQSGLNNRLFDVVFTPGPSLADTSRRDARHRHRTKDVSRILV